METTTLLTSLARGINPRQTAREMTAALDGNRARALTIARTETLRAYREAGRQTAERAGVGSWQWIASKSRRTCLACLALDGQVFPIEQPQPSHPNCRCTVLYLPPGYNPPAREYGAQWFEKQPDEVKQAMMSKVAFEAYQRGDVKLQDFVGIRKSKAWGETRYERSFKDALKAAQKQGTKASVQQPLKWKPVMTKAEAEIWARDSIYPSVVHHITASSNVSSLEQAGFDLQRSKFGRVWGNGVYVATDAETIKLYQTWQGYDATTLELRINVRRIFTYDASQTGTRGMPYVIADQFPQGTARYNDLLAQINQRNSELRQQAMRLPEAGRRDFLRQSGYESFTEAAALTRLLQEKGYEGLRVTDRSGLSTPVGGNQIVVFDPQNVVILKR